MLSFSALNIINDTYRAKRNDRLTDVNDQIRCLTIKFTELEIPDCSVGWDELVDVGENESAQTIDINVELLWDSTKKKIFIRSEDNEPEVLAGVSADLRLEVAPMVIALLRAAERKLLDETHKLEVGAKLVKTVGLINSIDAIKDIFKRSKDDKEAQQDLEEYNFWKEKEDGRPSDGDDLMMNGIQD